MCDRRTFFGSPDGDRILHPNVHCKGLKGLDLSIFIQFLDRLILIFLFCKALVIFDLLAEVRPLSNPEARLRASAIQATHALNGPSIVHHADQLLEVILSLRAKNGPSIDGRR